MTTSRAGRLGDAAAPVTTEAPRRAHTLRLLSPRLHGLVDYTAAAGLILLPSVLPLGGSHPLQRVLSVGAGLGLVLYSLLTDYRYALARVVGFRTHLLLDALAAGAFLVLPFALGFDAFARTYYVANGLAVLAVVALSDPAPAER